MKVSGSSGAPRLGCRSATELDPDGRCVFVLQVSAEDRQTPGAAQRPRCPAVSGEFRGTVSVSVDHRDV